MLDNTADPQQSFDEEDQMINEEVFYEYKLIIKELLFNGADRRLKTDDGYRPIDIVRQHKTVFTAQQLKQIEIILKEHSSCFCC